MKLIINIYRVYDADLYALNMTVGRKMFGELLVAALKGYAAGTKPGITFGEISIPNQAEGINKRVIHIQKTIKDGTPEADMLSSIQPRLTGLFVKNLLRWYYFGSFQPFYFSEETEIEIPKTQTAQPRPKITPQKKVEKVENCREEGCRNARKYRPCKVSLQGCRGVNPEGNSFGTCPYTCRICNKAGRDGNASTYNGGSTGNSDTGACSTSRRRK